MISDKNLKAIITKSNLSIKEEDYKVAEDLAKQSNKTIAEILLDKQLLDETTLYKAAANYFEIEFVELKNKEIKKEVLELIPAPLAGTHQVVAFDQDKDKISLAMVDPTDIQTIEFLHRKTGLVPQVFITTPSDLKAALRKYHAELEDDINLKTVNEKIGDEIDTKALKKAAEELPVINIVNSQSPNCYIR